MKKDILEVLDDFIDWSLWIAGAAIGVYILFLLVLIFTI